MRAFRRVEYWFIVILFIMDVIVVFFQVLNRMIFQQNIPWTEELARYIVIWLGLVGGAIAFRTSSHIAIDAISSKFKGRSKFIMAEARHLMTIVFSLVIIYFGTQFVQGQYRSMQLSPAARWPMYIIEIAIPLGYALTIFEIVPLMIADFRSYRKGEF